MLFFVDNEGDNDEYRRMPGLQKLVALSAALLLSSCVFHPHQRALDMAQEYDAVAELDGAVYQAGNRFYVQGCGRRYAAAGTMCTTSRC